ncbi:MAG TPA: S41 family peptidase [Vicinamibacterales bacterium]|jgi:carboxyl-terminal processing protease
MSSSTRRLVLWISAPVVTFAIVGGFLSKVTAREDTYQHLRIFDDVVNLISGNYVEKADIDKVMTGAMHGLADSLDPDSAYLSVAEVKQLESNAALPNGDVGIDLTRQYYLRVIATRDGSPAAKAGIRTGDYVRVIGDTPTREMSVFQGMRLLRGAPGSKVKLTIIRGSTTDPHELELTREPIPTAEVSTKTVAPGVGYVRIASIGPRTAEQVKKDVNDLTKGGATKLVVDVRRTSGGSLDGGLALARLFVQTGTLTVKETRGAERETVAAGSGDGSVTVPTTLLVDTGTSGAAELFASALVGNKRAELIGEHTIGRAALQKLFKLPDGSGLWLTTTKFLTPAGTPLHEKGLEPSVAVDEPDVEFGQPAPTDDPVLQKALQRLTEKKAA